MNSCFWQIAWFWHPNQILCQLYFDVCQTIRMLSYALYLQYTVYNLSFFLPVSKNVCHWRLTAYQCQRGSKTACIHTTFAFIIPLLEVYILGNHFASTIVGPISVRPFSILSYWNTCDPDSATLCPKSSVDPLDLRNVHRQTCQAPKDWGSKTPC